MTTPKNLAGMTPSGTFGFSPALLGQSPAALLKHKSPLPSGAFGSSPGNISSLGIGLGVAGNIGMGMGASNTTTGPPDENRKGELSEILRLLHSRPGRVSELEVERIARGMGLESYKETGENGIVTVSVAAKIFLLDIEFSGSKVVRVAISFENTPGPSADLAPIAAAIFQETLNPTISRTPSLKNPILPPSLAEFSENLQRFALTDKLSKTGLNCFTAITGVYESLKKIYDYEKESIDELSALCFGSGRPQMHVRRKIGLSIDYWLSRKMIPTREDGPDSKRWRVLIEVQEVQPELAGGITPVRSSNQWVGDEIHKPKDDNLFGDMDETTIDWLEPPHEEFPDPPVDPSLPRPPLARFSARLDPPVMVSLFDEVDSTITASFPGQDINPLMTLLFPKLEVKQPANRRVYVPGAGEDKIIHSYRMRSDLKPGFSRMVSEVPISHPKDLLPIFKTLRQYALLETLLASCFSRESTQDEIDNETKGEEMDIDLETFLSGTNDLSTPLNVDLSLMPEHGFGIDVVFPLAGNPVHINIIVEKNGELKAIVPEGGLNGAATGLDIKAFERGLRASEDIPLMIEWVRRSCLGLL